MDTQTAAGVAGRLAQLESEERTVSSKRRRLQDRIDFMRSGRAADTPDAPALLAQLLSDERALSVHRRALHAQIDELRIELGQEPGPRKRQTLLGG